MVNIFIILHVYIGLQVNILSLQISNVQCDQCAGFNDLDPTTSPTPAGTNTPTRNPTQLNCRDIFNREQCGTFSECCFCDDPTFWQPAGIVMY